MIPTISATVSSLPLEGLALQIHKRARRAYVAALALKDDATPSLLLEPLRALEGHGHTADLAVADLTEKVRQKAAERGSTGTTASTLTFHL